MGAEESVVEDGCHFVISHVGVSCVQKELSWSQGWYPEWQQMKKMCQ